MSTSPLLSSSYLLHSWRHRLQEPRALQVYGFLYDEYRAHMYWWLSITQLQNAGAGGDAGVHDQKR
jgi:hypothetical protein